MTPEEQQAMVQFMGTVHGQAKQTDQMIVGHSNFVRPVSTDIKAALTAGLSQPTSSRGMAQQPPTQLPVAEAVPSHTVTPEQAAQELAQVTSAQVVAPLPVQPMSDELAPVDPNQMEFDLSEQTKLDKIVELLERQNRILLEVKNNYAKSIKSSRKRQAE